MIRSPSYTGQFKRDVKLAEKRGRDMSKMRTVLDWELAGEQFPRELGDHALNLKTAVDDKKLARKPRG